METAFRLLAECNILILYLLDGRNLNPLIAEEYIRLKQAGLLDAPLNATVLEHLVQQKNVLRPAAYCPAPMAREMAHGTAFSFSLTERYCYDYIQIDAEQNWYLKGRFLDLRFKKFLQEALFYEPSLGRYYVEYSVDERFDKCYLDCAITPMVALHVEHREARLEALLNNGKHDELDLGSFRLDGQERLFCGSVGHGEVLVADNPRFLILEHLTADGRSLRFGEATYPVSRGNSLP